MPFILPDFPVPRVPAQYSSALNALCRRSSLACITGWPGAPSAITRST